MKNKLKAIKTVKLKTGTATSEPKLAPNKLMLLIVVVDSHKADFYSDILQSFEINMRIVFSGRGTARTEMLGMLGLTDTEKSVIIGAVREDRAKDALSALDEKFHTIKNGKGVACTVPLTSTIGVAIYRFLSNCK